MTAGIGSTWRSAPMDAGGEADFHGRSARRYVVTVEDVREEFYLDAESGFPVGSKFSFTSTGPGGEQHIDTEVTTVEALEHLPATTEDLGELSG
jgi:hypothetical protein